MTLSIQSEPREPIWCIQAEFFVFQYPFNCSNLIISIHFLVCSHSFFQKMQIYPKNFRESCIQNVLWAFYTLRMYLQPAEDFETTR